MNYGQLPHPMYGYRATSSQLPSADINMLTSGLPSLSVSSSSPSPVIGGSGVYSSQPNPLPYGMPSGDQLLGFDNNLAYPPANGPASGRQWSVDSHSSLGVNDSNVQYSTANYGVGDGEYDDEDRNSLAPSTAPSLSMSSPNSMSPVSAPSPGDLGAYTTPSTMTMASGQWSNTSIVTQGMPDPIEPFFKTLRERNLVSHSIPNYFLLSYSMIPFVRFDTIPAIVLI